MEDIINLSSRYSPQFTNGTLSIPRENLKLVGNSNGDMDTDGWGKESNTTNKTRTLAKTATALAVRKEMIEKRSTTATVFENEIEPLIQIYFKREGVETQTYLG